MEAFGLLMHGFAVLLTWKTLTLMMVGLVLGVFIGVLPGLGGPNGVAILLPLTFTMDPTSAIVMLSCIYWGALFGGAITSILFNVPGEAWSVATTFDGYPMAQQGRAAEALTAAFTSSFIGSLAAVLLITFLAPMISSFALKFGPPEFFAVYLLNFCSFVGLGREPNTRPSSRCRWACCWRASAWIRYANRKSTISKLLERTGRELFPRMQLRYTLDSLQHQCIANAQTRCGRPEVSAILGDLFVGESSRNYSHRRRAWDDSHITAIPEPMKESVLRFGRILKMYDDRKALRAM